MKYTKTILLCIVYYLLCSNINAQLLYEISGNGLTKSSYIFGTHHLIQVETATQIPGLFRAFNDCDVVVSEFVDDDQNKMQQRILSASKMEKSIFDMLTPADEALVDSALQAELGLSLANVQYMRPNIIAIIYETAVYERVLKQKSNDIAMDSYFQIAGIELGKSVVGLETLEQQMHMLLRSITIERQIEILVETIRNSKNIPAENAQLDSLYVAGNIDALYDMLVKAEDMTEAEKFLLVDERNIAWLPKIEEYIKQNPCFIAVGALHLPGKDGVINLLRKAGYKVKAVK